MQQQKIRNQIRKLRNLLSIQQQVEAAQKIKQRVLKHPKIIQAKHIAVFKSFDGEINTEPLIDKLRQLKKQIYLPVIPPQQTKPLIFLPYNPNTQLEHNQYGIYQPFFQENLVCPLSRLQIMFVPLVAFDQQGNRLGMGGGYYDNLLQGWQNKNFYPIGLAHDCQQIDSMPIQVWDIPLPEILTPSKHWSWIK